MDQGVADSKRIWLLPATIVVLLAFWLRIHQLAVYPPGISGDEALNGVNVFHISRGADIPLFENPWVPEPSYRVVLGLNTRFFGSTVFAYRMTSVFFGTLTIAAAYWATRQVLGDLPSFYRGTAAFTTAITLAIALGHITLSRAMYRAIPQPLCMFGFIGFMSLALRKMRWRYFVCAGISLSGTVYFYTAGLVLPTVLAPLAISIGVFYYRDRRILVPGFLLVVFVVLVLTLPFSITLLTRPEAIIRRAQDVSGMPWNVEQMVRFTIDHLFRAGDPNPQYNTARAALIPNVVQPLFVVGLLYLAVRVRHASSVILASFLVLGAIPPLLTGEPIHGLRVVGLYGVFPIIVGLGVALLLSLFRKLPGVPERAAKCIGVGLAGVFFVVGGAHAHQTYVDYWENPPMVFMFDRDLTSGDWYFRTDRRDLAEWLMAQDVPLLLPLRELAQPTTLVWLQERYPDVEWAGDDITLPTGTRLIFPWVLEKSLTDDPYWSDERIYGLLHAGKITVLPPLSLETHQALLTGIEQGTAIIRNGQPDFLGYVVDVPADLSITYEPYALTTTDVPLAAFGDGEVNVTGWRGPVALDGTAGRMSSYFVDWVPTERPGHLYNTFLQMQTQSYQSVAGLDIELWAGLYPSTRWQAGDTITSEYQLVLPNALAPGAYRLVTGLYYEWGYLTAESLIIDSLPNQATIGWIKVPQLEQPIVPARINRIDAILGDSFRLIGAELIALSGEQVQVTLFWESLVDRPDLDATIFVHLENAEREILSQQDARPWNGQYPTFIWDSEEIVETDLVLPLPENQLLTDLQVLVGMYTLPDVQRLAVFQNSEQTWDNRVHLGSIEDLLHK